MSVRQHPHSATACRRFVMLALVVAAALLAGCASTQSFSPPEPARIASGARVLIMPPDIELGQINTAGLYAPKADWTYDAQRHVLATLIQALRDRGHVGTVYGGDPQTVAPIEREHAQSVKLFEAVRQTVLQYKHFAGTGSGLPTKKDRFDWTLGPEGVAPLRATYDADYALFTLFRDRSPTGGRVAMEIAVAVLFGAYGSTDNQLGFAALVDLRSGDLLWTNLMTQTFGDLRTQADADSAVQTLLGDAPL